MDPDKQYQCTQCDPGAPTEQCIPELSVCAKLTDTAIILFGTNGVWHSSTGLNTHCSPRSLQKLTQTGVHLSVGCKEFSSQVASIEGTTVNLHDSSGWTVQSETMVEGMDNNGVKTMYHVDIDGDTLYQTNFHTGQPVDITPDLDEHCSFISLFPLYTRDRFLLWCEASTDKRLYTYGIITDHAIPEHIPYIISNSPPLSSPDGKTFITVTNSTLKAYTTDNLTTQPPGARDFGSIIVFHTYIDNNTLLLHIESETQILVDVAKFINSAGSEGIFNLPFASNTATLQKLVTSGVYATCNKTGSLFNLLLFNTSNGELIDTFPGFDETLLDIFFQRGSFQSTRVQTYSATISMLTSAKLTTSQERVLLTPTSSSTPPVEPTSRKSSNVAVFVAIAAILTFLILSSILIAFVLIIRRPQMMAKLSCRHPNGPFTQATDDKSSDLV